MSERSSTLARNCLMKTFSPDENVETYARKLYEFSEQANVPNREESIRDRLVLGVRDRELSEKLQLQANLTLKDAVRQ